MRRGAHGAGRALPCLHRLRHHDGVLVSVNEFRDFLREYWFPIAMLVIVAGVAAVLVIVLPALA